MERNKLNKKERRESRRGFTLTELLVVMAIFGLLLLLVVINFQYGNKNADLRDSATELIQNIRMLQSWASSGKEIRVCGNGIDENKPCDLNENCDGDCDQYLIPTGGYGIKLLDTEAVKSYQLFIDVDGCERCDDGEELVNGIISLKGNVIIKELAIDGTTSFVKADLIFQPPTSKIYLNANCIDENSNQVQCIEGGICIGNATLENEGKVLTITLEHEETGNRQEIEVNAISGKIGLIEE